MSGAITIIRRPTIVNYTIQNFARFKFFSFIATENGQTLFTPLPYRPVSIIGCAINGTSQNIGEGDITFEGLNLMTNAGLDIGDVIYGVMQI